jgi:hypothetical protein
MPKSKKAENPGRTVRSYHTQLGCGKRYSGVERTVANLVRMHTKTCLICQNHKSTVYCSSTRDQCLKSQAVTLLHSEGSVDDKVDLLSKEKEEAKSACSWQPNNSEYLGDSKYRLTNDYGDSQVMRVVMKDKEGKEMEIKGGVHNIVKSINYN